MAVSEGTSNSNATDDNDLERLQGTWNISSLEVDGHKMPDVMLSEATVVVKGRRFTTTGMGAVYEGTLKLDASKDPPQLDMTFDVGPESGNTNRGIYKLTKDSWRLCLATHGDIRPSRFASTPGSGIALEILTREKHKTRKSDPAPIPATGTASIEFEGEWQMVSGVMNGVPMEQSTVQWVRRLTRGNQTTVQAGPQTMMKFTFTNDASKSPKAIDYVNSAGANKGKTQLGIYEFEGALLKVCMASPGAPRPTEFQSVRGDGITFTVWKRS